jgi:hypothetical protein
MGYAKVFSSRKKGQCAGTHQWASRLEHQVCEEARKARITLADPVESEPI